MMRGCGLHDDELGLTDMEARVGGAVDRTVENGYDEDRTVGNSYDEEFFHGGSVSSVGDSHRKKYEGGRSERDTGERACVEDGADCNMARGLDLDLDVSGEKNCGSRCDDVADIHGGCKSTSGKGNCGAYGCQRGAGGNPSRNTADDWNKDKKTTFEGQNGTGGSTSRVAVKQEGGRRGPSSCIKCLSMPAEAVVNQHEHVCSGCLKISLFSKFRTAISKHSLISTDDRVLLAFSGGHASRVALDFVHQIQSTAKTERELLEERGRIRFHFAVAFVDESAALGVPIETALEIENSIESVVRGHSYGSSSSIVAFHAASLEDLLTENDDDDDDDGVADNDDDGHGHEVVAGFQHILDGYQHIPDHHSLPRQMHRNAQTLKSRKMTFLGKDGIVDYVSSSSIPETIIDLSLKCESASSHGDSEKEGKSSLQGRPNLEERSNLEGGTSLERRSNLEGRANLEGRSNVDEDPDHKGPEARIQRRRKARAFVAKMFKDVSDSSGRQDLAVHLRSLLLQKVAKRNGYTKILQGDSATRLAVHALAATCKGRGFSLPADVQFLDGRWDVPVIRPLRECLAKELATHARKAMLKTVFIPNSATLCGPQFSIDALADTFVNAIQEDLPSRVHTILRTAGKLKSFPFNGICDGLLREGSCASQGISAWQTNVNQSAAARPPTSRNDSAAAKGVGNMSPEIGDSSGTVKSSAILGEGVHHEKNSKASLPRYPDNASLPAHVSGSDIATSVLVSDVSVSCFAGHRLCPICGAPLAPNEMIRSLQSLGLSMASTHNSVAKDTDQSDERKIVVAKLLDPEWRKDQRSSSVNLTAICDDGTQNERVDKDDKKQNKFGVAELCCDGCVRQFLRSRASGSARSMKWSEDKISSNEALLAHAIRARVIDEREKMRSLSERRVQAWSELREFILTDDA